MATGIGKGIPGTESQGVAARNEEGSARGWRSGYCFEVMSRSQRRVYW